MSKIVIGKTGRKKAVIDVNKLLRTRLLIQANSGGGKSWLIRRLAEQLFGKVQVIIIDPDGEFATLREKFGYVLVGEGGETPAHPRSAALVAEKLLELRSSAVCDLYEVKPSERHRWVRLFLDAMVDAPKKLWHPVVVVVDEAHVFCPEKGAGESEASDAMIGLATRGRKRGFCAVFATQRLGKLRKDAAAELLNIMIGMTFIDVDRKRAADALGISEKKQKEKFFDDVKVMDEGYFWGLGRAISKERILIKVGSVQTTHPKPGSTKHSAKPPPAPSKVKKLLPKLADLPQEAEEKAKTEGELRKEIRSLKAQLRAAPKERVKDAPVVQAKVDPRELEKAIQAAVKEVNGRWEGEVQKYRNILEWVAKTFREATKNVNVVLKSPKLKPAPSKSMVRRLTTQLKPKAAPVSAPVREKKPVRAAAPKMDVDVDGLSRPQSEILRALSEFDAIGKDIVPRSWVAVRSGASPKSSAFSNNLSALRTRGLIEYREGKTIAFTSEGRGVTPEVAEPLSSEEMLESCLTLVSKPQQEILRVLYEAHPDAVARDEVAERSGASPVSSAYSNNLSALRSGGMIEYQPGKMLRCSDGMFVD